MHCWANGTSRISEFLQDWRWVSVLFLSPQETQIVLSISVTNRVCLHLLFSEYGSVRVWASVFGLVIDGPACCLWHCLGWIIARVVAADLWPAGSHELWWTHRGPSVPGRNIMKPRGHPKLKLEQSEKESHFFFFTHSVSPHITKLWRG